MTYNKSNNNNEQELIGQLFINQSKDGRTTYLRGHVNGQKVVCFLNKKTGTSYHVLSDSRTDEVKTESKSSAAKPRSYAAKKPYNNEDAPF